jgi:hypothetical protein
MRTALAIVVLSACGRSDGPAIDAPIATGWTPLISRAWVVPPGSADTYKCIRIAITEEIWVSGFRAIAPPGTHHTVVTVSTNGDHVGEHDCMDGSGDMQMLYASGVGTDELSFPEGVAIKLVPGQYLNLNLHLFNASDTPLTGTSGVEAFRRDPAGVVHEADMTFVGTMDIAIPGDGQPHTVTGGCVLDRGWNMFAVWPHMHQHATHQSFRITKAGVVTTILDNKPYSFDEQTNYPIAPMRLEPGDRVETSCTYVNTTGAPVHYGDSSNQEMCYTGVYKYPAGGVLFSCPI